MSDICLCRPVFLCRLSVPFIIMCTKYRKDCVKNVILLHSGLLGLSSASALVLALGRVEIVSERDSVCTHGHLAQLSERVGLAVYPRFC